MICDIAEFKFRYLHKVQTFERITRSHQETSELQYHPKKIPQIHKILEKEYVVHVFGLSCYTYRFKIREKHNLCFTLFRYFIHLSRQRFVEKHYRNNNNTALANEYINEAMEIKTKTD